MRHSHSVTLTQHTDAQSEPRPIIVLGCHNAGDVVLALEEVCRKFATVVACEERVDVAPLSLRLGAQLVLLPLHDASGVPTAPLIARMCEVRIVVGVCIGRDSPPRDLAAALHAGGELVYWDDHHGLPSRLFSLLRDADISTGETQALTTTVDSLNQPRELADLFVRCTKEAHRRFDVRMLAATMGMSPRTLNRMMQRAGWPAPAEVISWSRLMRAAIAQWSGSGTGTTLARLSGFSSMASLKSTARLRMKAELDDLTPLRVIRGFYLRLRQRPEPL